MHLTRIHIEHLRNLISEQVQADVGFNVFYGFNGSGKTSLLEAIHYLGLGRSFRSRQSKYIVHHAAEKLAVFGQLYSDEVVTTIGIERYKNGDYQYRVASENVTTSAELARILPLQVIHPASHTLLTGGPKQRRQFIDWGVFHVEHDFFSCWQRTEKALKQRNAALKARRQAAEIDIWSQEFIVVAEQLDALRVAYLEKLEPVFVEVLSQLLHDFPVVFRYRRGWDSQTRLEEVLACSMERDRYQGFTQYGPHKAELLLTMDGVPVQDIFSQGQLKLVVYALRLAQGIMLRQYARKPCIYLLDDLPAELDEVKRNLVIEVLAELESQVFITTVESESLATGLQGLPTKKFHVERGKICRVS